MKCKRVLSLLLCSSLLLGASFNAAYAASSNVSLTVQGGGSSGGGGSEGGGGSGGGGSSGGSTVTPAEKPNKPGVDAGGVDSSGNDYILRPGISVDKAVKKNGYIIGKNNWVFDPNGALTRAEFATIMDRVFVFQDESIKKRFDDTKGHWAEDAICRLASNGVIQGVSSREFNPQGTLKRDEALLMISRVVYTDKYSGSTNKVNLNGHYAKESLSKIINSGIYSKLDAKFDVRAVISRDEMIHIVNNIIYPRNKSVAGVEGYLREKGVFKDLLQNSKDCYYNDCLKSLDQNHLKSELGR